MEIGTNECNSRSSNMSAIDFLGTTAFDNIKPGQHLAAEVEEGNHEYKFKLTNLTDTQLNHRVTQLLWRLREGNDEAVYHIGVEDNGNHLGLTPEELQESLKTLRFMADQADCDMVLRQLFHGERGITAEVLLKRKLRSGLDSTQVVVAFAGDVDCGKSTLIGVLSTGQLDNGKGLARMQVMKHYHEVETGRTSSISHTLLHFNTDGKLMNVQSRIRGLSDLEVAHESVRAVALVDLAGDARYLKTTLHGLSSLKPDYCLVCVSASKGVRSMTAEHLAIGLSLQVPIVIAITKIDTVSSERTEQVIQQVQSMLPKPTVVLRQLEDLRPLQEDLEGSAVPVFLLSSVTGQGLEQLTLFLRRLVPLDRATVFSKKLQEEQGEEKEAFASGEEVFVRILGSLPKPSDEAGENQEGNARGEEAGETLAGLGASSIGGTRSVADMDLDRVLIGKVMRGTMHIGEVLMVGPNVRGEFGAVEVVSLRLSNVPVHCATAGHCVTFCLRAHSASPPQERAEYGAGSTAAATPAISAGGNGKGNTRRGAAAGLVLLSPVAVWPQAVWEFRAHVKVTNHASKIRVNYQAVVHIGAVKQTAKILSIESDEANSRIEPQTLGNGETAVCRIRFLYYPEYVLPGELLLIREDRTKATGKVLSISG